MPQVEILLLEGQNSPLMAAALAAEMLEMVVAVAVERVGLVARGLVHRDPAGLDTPRQQLQQPEQTGPEIVAVAVAVAVVVDLHFLAEAEAEAVLG